MPQHCRSRLLTSLHRQGTNPFGTMPPLSVAQSTNTSSPSTKKPRARGRMAQTLSWMPAAGASTAAEVRCLHWHRGVCRCGQKTFGQTLLALARVFDRLTKCAGQLHSLSSLVLPPRLQHARCQCCRCTPPSSLLGCTRWAGRLGVVRSPQDAPLVHVLTARSMQAQALA